MEIRTFDMSEFLENDEQIALYFSEILKEGDLALTLSALGDIAKAKNMTELSRKTGISRRGLYKALTSDGNPSFETVLKVMNALNLTFDCKPKTATVEA